MRRTVAIRDLRNDTAAVIALAEEAGEVVITNYGRPVAVLRPFEPSWADRVGDLVERLSPPVDTGLAEILAADDADSQD